MKRYICILFAMLLAASSLMAQERMVENRPYTDLRPFHFGIFVGAHLQDVEFNNIGPQTITAEDGTTQEVLINGDQDRWDPGFTVGVLGEFRLHTNFQLRIAPAMYFGNKHLTFRNQTESATSEKPVELQQDLKSVYFATAAELIFSAPRFNNHRPYIMTGINPMINLNLKDDDIVRMKRYDVYAEIGVGCDFYLPFFKLRPELKFMYGLTNSLDTKHADNLRDASLIPSAKSVNEAHNKMIALTFYFE